MLGRVHAADLGAVGLALLAAVAPGANALDEYQRMGMGAVRGAQQRAAGGARRVHQPLELQAGHHVRALGVGELVELLHGDGLEAGGGDDCAIFLLNQLILLGVVDGPGGTDLGADTALAGFQHGTVVGVDGGHLGHRLGEGDVDGPAVVQP